MKIIGCIFDRDIASFDNLKDTIMSYDRYIQDNVVTFLLSRVISLQDYCDNLSSKNDTVYKLKLQFGEEHIAYFKDRERDGLLKFEIKESIGDGRELIQKGEQVYKERVFNKKCISIIAVENQKKIGDDDIGDDDSTIIGECLLCQERSQFLMSQFLVFLLDMILESSQQNEYKSSLLRLNLISVQNFPVEEVTTELMVGESVIDVSDREVTRQDHKTPKKTELLLEHRQTVIKTPDNQWKTRKTKYGLTNIVDQPPNQQVEIELKHLVINGDQHDKQSRQIMQSPKTVAESPESIQQTSSGQQKEEIARRRKLEYASSFSLVDTRKDNVAKAVRSGTCVLSTDEVDIYPMPEEVVPSYPMPEEVVPSRTYVLLSNDDDPTKQVVKKQPTKKTTALLLEHRKT